MHHRRQSLSVRKLCSWSRLLSTKGQRYSGWINESKLQLWSNSDFHLKLEKSVIRTPSSGWIHGYRVIGSLSISNHPGTAQLIIKWQWNAERIISSFVNIHLLLWLCLRGCNCVNADLQPNVLWELLLLLFFGLTPGHVPNGLILFDIHSMWIAVVS